jgi:hypothetical protein
MFEVISKDDHVDGGPVDTFGYMSVHYICRLGNKHAGARYSGLTEQVFEIQIRTIVMDAWANVSHQLAYKGESSIPESLRRDFHALSGLFYVADQHFELFSKQAQAAQASAKEAIEANVAQDLGVNLESVSALLRDLYPERERSPRIAIAEFVEELIALGYDKIGRSGIVLMSKFDEARSLEQKHPPTSPSRRYADVGIARTTLTLVHPDYDKMLLEKAKKAALGT